MPNEQFATPAMPNELPRQSPENAYYRNVETLAATGSTQADAAAIVSASGALVVVTAADGTKGVRLPPITVVGQEFVVKNVDNAILKVYGSTSGVINTLSANAAISMAARTIATFVAIDSTTWYTAPLLPS